ncbi:MAG TPA: cobalamin-dependent protein [Terriglobales bacterium]|nr:cobalamin-dependent protein [Terriglobales bacterium]
MLTWSTERSAPLDDSIRELAAETAKRHLAQGPESFGYRKVGRSQCEEDTEYHLCFLSEAITTGRPSLFARYVDWRASMLASRGIEPQEFARKLELLRGVVQERLPEPTSAVASEIITSALARTRGQLPDIPTFLPDSAPHVEVARTFLNLLLSGRRDQAAEMLSELMAKGMALGVICQSIIEPSQREVGRLWQMNRITAAHEHYCTQAVQWTMTRLTAAAVRTPKRDRRVIAASVANEYHDVGIRMLADLMELDGWEVFYLGANTPGAALFQLASVLRPDVIALSATMPFNIESVRQTTVAVNALVPKATVIVGGQAFANEPDVWEHTEADAYAQNAAEAVDVIDSLVDGGQKFAASD